MPTCLRGAVFLRHSVYDFHHNNVTSASRLSMNLSTTCRKYLKLSSRTKSYSQSAGDITTPPCDLRLLPDLDESQLVGVYCPLNVYWSDMDSVAGDDRSAWHVADLWIPAAEAKPAATLLPFLTDCDSGGTVSACVAGMCNPNADAESTETLLLFLRWFMDLPDLTVCPDADWAVAKSSSLGGGAIFNSRCINFLRSDSRWSCFFITW